MAIWDSAIYHSLIRLDEENTIGTSQLGYYYSFFSFSISLFPFHPPIPFVCPDTLTPPPPLVGHVALVLRGEIAAERPLVAKGGFVRASMSRGVVMSALVMSQPY